MAPFQIKVGQIYGNIYFDFETVTAEGAQPQKPLAQRKPPFDKILGERTLEYPTITPSY